MNRILKAFVSFKTKFSSSTTNTETVETTNIESQAMQQASENKENIGSIVEAPQRREEEFVLVESASCLQPAISLQGTQNASTNVSYVISTPPSEPSISCSTKQGPESSPNQVLLQQNPTSVRQLAEQVSSDALFLNSPRRSCVELFRISEEALLDLIYDKNAVLRKAFYGDLVMKAIVAAEIWKLLGIHVTPEVMQLKRSYYESNANLAMFLIYGTDFESICKKYRYRIRNRNLHSLGSILEALLWDSNLSEEKSIYRLHEWQDVCTEIMLWIDTYVVAADEDNRTVAQGLASIFDLQDNPKAFSSLAMAQQDSFSVGVSQTKTSPERVAASVFPSTHRDMEGSASSLKEFPKTDRSLPPPVASSGAPSVSPSVSPSVGPSPALGSLRPMNEHESDIGILADEADNDEGSVAPSTLTAATFALHSVSPYMYQTQSRTAETVFSKEYILANMSSWNSAVFNRHLATGEVNYIYYHYPLFQFNIE